MEKKPIKSTRPRRSSKSKASSNGLWAYVVRYVTHKSPAGWLGLLVKAIAAYGLSTVLQSLTQGALWFPQEWREVITFISSFMFVAAAELAGLMAQGYEPKASGSKKRKGEKPSHTRLLCRVFIALICIGGAIYFVNLTNELRDSSVWRFSPKPDFWEKRFATVNGSTNQYQTPDVLSKEHGTIYFPSDIPNADLAKKVRNYAAYQAPKYGYSLDTNDLKACIKVIVDVDPDVIFEDWATSGPGTQARHQADMEFMRFHFAAVLLLALAWGCFNKEEEFALETFINIFASGK